MSTTTLNSQRFAQRLSVCAPVASSAFAATSVAYAPEAAPVSAVPATATGNAVVTGLGHDMAWLGGLGENVKFSDTTCTKRITTGRLDRVLT